MTELYKALYQQSFDTTDFQKPAPTEDELLLLFEQIPEWTTIEENGISKLKRSFSMTNFVEAMAFAEKVSELAESLNHHPTVTIEWGKCTVVWWTHAVNGLHKADFIMAAKTDQL